MKYDVKNLKGVRPFLTEIKLNLNFYLCFFLRLISRCRILVHPSKDHISFILQTWKISMVNNRSWRINRHSKIEPKFYNFEFKIKIVNFCDYLGIRILNHENKIFGGGQEMWETEIRVIKLFVWEFLKEALFCIQFYLSDLALDAYCRYWLD